LTKGEETRASSRGSNRKPYLATKGEKTVIEGGGPQLAIKKYLGEGRVKRVRDSDE